MSFQMHQDDAEELVPSADINVTPFIDVMLVLLIIFMVTAPMLAQGMKVNLPKAGAAGPLENVKAVTITIAADGRLQVGDEVVERGGLAQAVRTRLPEPNSPIRIRADRQTRYEDLMRVIDGLIADGLTRFTFQTTTSTDR